MYTLGQVEDLRPLSLGISNSNYAVLLEGGQKYLLKISNDKNVKQLSDEQQILNYLKELHYPYSLSPLPTKKGQSIYEFEELYGVVYPFIEGIPPGPSDQTCHEIGQALAKLHALPKAQTYSSLRDHQEVGFSADDILKYLQGTHCPEDFKKHFLEAFPDQLKKWQAENFEEGLIHGDLYYDNTLFHNNHLAAVLDFEQSGRGELVLDLGICMSGTCLEKGRLSRALIKSFLEGYESVRLLPQNEKMFLDTSILLGLFSIALWRIKRFREGDLDPGMSESYKELLGRAITYKRSLQ